MTSKPPFPQVGALLYLDTELDGDFETGGKHWKLAGSCVLVAPDLVLTIGHILGEREPRLERYRVFLPYQGLLRIAEKAPHAPHEEKPIQWEDQVMGDNLALIRLEDSVREGTPLRPRKVKSLYKYKGSALVCGYGSWPGTGLGRLEGIQQQHTVLLGPPRNGKVQWQHYDNLDLSWSASDHGGLIAGRGNSGGPMLAQRDHQLPHIVVGITRETGADQQAGAWIGWDRWRWLREPTKPLKEQTQGDRPRREYHPLTIKGIPGELIRLPTNGARRVKATLNASQGMRLQMGIASRSEDLQQLEQCDGASGRFLYRDFDLKAGTEEIFIRVCPVARAPKLVDEVLAQLCVLFL